METVVGSVFVAGNRAKTWYDLQMRFLHKTTANFHHIVFLNGKEFDFSLEYSEIVGQSDLTGLEKIGTAKEQQLAQKDNHYLGLSILLDHFKKIEAENYLILDCDCFPVQDNWVGILKKACLQRNKVFAAPIRTENFDLFPHPCALFFGKEVLQQDWFDLSSGETVNLMGNLVYESGGKLPKEKCLPLLRTNCFNVHPIFSGIYGDIFYHHACGSRPKTFLARGIGESILRRQVDHWSIEEEIFRKLSSNPDEFVQSLLFLGDD